MSNTNIESSVTLIDNKVQIKLDMSLDVLLETLTYGSEMSIKELQEKFDKNPILLEKFLGIVGLNTAGFLQNELDQYSDLQVFAEELKK